MRSRPLKVQLLPIDYVPDQSSTSDETWSEIFKQYSTSGGIKFTQAARMANVERYNAGDSQKHHVCLGWRSEKGANYPAMLRVNAGCDEFQESGDQWAMRFFIHLDGVKIAMRVKDSRTDEAMAHISNISDPNPTNICIARSSIVPYYEGADLGDGLSIDTHGKLQCVEDGSGCDNNNYIGKKRDRYVGKDVLTMGPCDETTDAGVGISQNEDGKTFSMRLIGTNQCAEYVRASYSNFILVMVDCAADTDAQKFFFMNDEDVWYSSARCAPPLALICAASNHSPSPILVRR